MLRLKMPVLPSFGEVTHNQVMPLATKIILGCLICVIEGLFTNALFKLPKDVGFYYGYLGISIAVWLAMMRFRGTKLGADIGELCVYDIMSAALALIYYQLGQSTEVFWYLFTAIAFLKIIRVYAHFGTTTCDHGWGVFGFMTYFHQKKYPTGEDSATRQKMAIALVMAIGLGILATLAYKALNADERKIVPWALAVTYVIINGPILLNALAGFIAKYNAMDKRETAIAAAKADMQETIIAFQKKHDLPNEKAAKLLALFLSIEERKQNNLIELAEILASSYPTTSPPPKD
jgi:hypothetical protein